MGEHDVAQLIHQLVEHTITRIHVLDDSSRQTALQSLYTLAMRLLGTNLAGSTLHDEQGLLHAMKQDLDQRGATQQSARLLDCHARLTASGGLEPGTRVRLLALLQRVAKDSGHAGAASLIGPALMDTSGLTLLHASLMGMSSRPSSAATGKGQQPAGYTVTFPPSLENTLTGTGSIRDQQVSAKPCVNTRPAIGTSTYDRAGTFTVKEPLMVRDVLYACQGIAGKFTSWHEGGPAASTPGARGAGTPGSRGSSGRPRIDTAAAADQGPPGSCVVSNPDIGSGYSVVAGAGVTGVEAQLVAQLTELGWLFRRVQSHVSRLALGAASGAARQALYGALQAELSDFYRLMAVLETYAGQPLPVPGDDDHSATYLTLRRLVVWLGEPCQRMRLLASLADATADQAGGALAGAVHALTKHGDPFVAGYMGKVLNTVCVPIFGMIHKWVFEGVLDDPYGEFFVRAAPWLVQLRKRAHAAGGGLLALSGHEVGSTVSSAAQDLWRDGYTLHAPQLPAFISDSLARKVLRAGKSINFLQDVCGDVRWAQEAGMGAAAAAAAAGGGLDALAALERGVDNATALVDRRVMAVLAEQHQLARHAEAVRRYLLLGQGDFVQALMDQVSKELDQPAGNVSETQLSHALRAALSASCAKYEEEEVAERLRARKDRSATGREHGWDVFSLQYDIQGPLATVLTPAAMAQYLRIFQLLWRLKRVEVSLAAVWTSLQCEVQRTLRRLPKDVAGASATQEVARRCLRLRADMGHFVTNLQYYLHFEVMEAAWQEYCTRATAARDLDALIAAHEDYLGTMLTKALLGAECQELRVTLNEMTDNMLGLHGLVRRLNELVQAADRLQVHRARRVVERTKAGQWGAVQEERGAAEGVTPAELADIGRRLGELERVHSRTLGAFTQQLPAQAHDGVRFLLYRLDMSDFTARMRRAEEERGEDD